jgi:arsenate reductase
MVRGFFNSYNSKAFGDSAGIKPADQVDFNAVIVMREVGIDISSYKPKSLTLDMNMEFDYIVTMGCMSRCPITPREKTIEWNIEDPKGKSLDKYREIRDTISRKIKDFIRELFE